MFCCSCPCSARRSSSSRCFGELENGQIVLTSGGIIGTITEIKEDDTLICVSSPTASSCRWPAAPCRVWSRRKRRNRPSREREGVMSKSVRNASQSSLQAILLLASTASSGCRSRRKSWSPSQEQHQAGAGPEGRQPPGAAGPGSGRGQGRGGPHYRIAEDGTAEGGASTIPRSTATTRRPSSRRRYDPDQIHGVPASKSGDLRALIADKFPTWILDAGQFDRLPVEHGPDRVDRAQEGHG